MKRFYLFVLTLVVFVAQAAAAPIGSWNNYQAYGDITQIECAGNKVYVLSSKGLYSYNNADNSIQTYDKTKFARTGKLVGATLVDDEDEVMIINSDGVIIRIRANEVSTSGRSTQGVKIMRVNEEGRIVSFAKVVDEENQGRPGDDSDADAEGADEMAEDVEFTEEADAEDLVAEDLEEE